MSASMQCWQRRKGSLSTPPIGPCTETRRVRKVGNEVAMKVVVLSKPRKVSKGPDCSY
jgi:hypothetical protein